MSRPTTQRRRQILTDTIARTPAIIESHRDERADSSRFIHEDIKDLNNLGSNSHLNHPQPTPSILAIDSLVCARNLVSESSEATYAKRILVLNCCSGDAPGDHMERKLGTTQEDCLNYSSTLLHTLKLQSGNYPFHRHIKEVRGARVGGIYSPAVVVFKDDLKHDCANLQQQVCVSVVSVAAPKRPKVRDGVVIDHRMINEMKSRMRLVLKVAVQENKSVLVLGALGCGFYGWPARTVAEYWKDLLEERQFEGFFERVVIPVGMQGPVCNVFKEVFP